MYQANNPCQIGKQIPQEVWVVLYLILVEVVGACCCFHCYFHWTCHWVLNIGGKNDKLFLVLPQEISYQEMQRIPDFLHALKHEWVWSLFQNQLNLLQIPILSHFLHCSNLLQNFCS